MADLSPDDQIANVYPISKRGKHYLKYCTGWLSDAEKPLSITECVRKYTCTYGLDWYCTKVNIVLAADASTLSEHGPYIRQLKYSIAKSRMNFNGTVFRGADLSPSEIAAYESKNTLIHVDVTPEWSKFCMEIQPRHTDDPEEEEILFSCYNMYRYLRTEKTNGQRIIKLELLNYERYFDYRNNCIRDGNKYGVD